MESHSVLGKTYLNLGGEKSYNHKKFGASSASRVLFFVFWFGFFFFSWCVWDGARSCLFLRLACFFPATEMHICTQTPPVGPRGRIWERASCDASSHTSLLLWEPGEPEAPCSQRDRAGRTGEVSAATPPTARTSQLRAKGRSLTREARWMAAASAPSTALRTGRSGGRYPASPSLSGRTAHLPPRHSSSLPSSLSTSPSFAPAPHRHRLSSQPEPRPRPTSPPHLPSHHTTHLPTRPFLDGARAPAI